MLVVFEDDLAAHHFLGVARAEMRDARVELPLWVSHRRLLEREGPLGEAWTALHAAGATWLPAPVEARGLLRAGSR